MPCLIELFYMLRTRVSPNNIYKDINGYHIELISSDAGIHKTFYDDYCKITWTNAYDYADYFLARSALKLPGSQILTMDKDDFMNAYNQAFTDQKPSNIHGVDDKTF